MSRSELMSKISKIDSYLMNEVYKTRGGVKGKPFTGDKNQHLRDELVELRKQLSEID